MTCRGRGPAPAATPSTASLPHELPPAALQSLAAVCTPTRLVLLLASLLASSPLLLALLPSFGFAQPAALCPLSSPLHCCFLLIELYQCTVFIAKFAIYQACSVDAAAGKNAVAVGLCVGARIKEHGSEWQKREQCWALEGQGKQC